MFHKIFWIVLVCVVCGRGALAAEGENLFLDDVQQRSFRYFWDEANPATGLIPDRAGADGQKHYPICSIASVGFGLTAICVADHRQWVGHEVAYQRVLTTLRFLLDQTPQEHGFFYHYVDVQTGERRWDSEVSSLDTALLMAGVLTVRQYYPATEAAKLATSLYERVDWPWMLNQGKTFSMGWRPGSGFLAERWDDYSEHMILDLLAIGSPTHPAPPATWQAWRRTSLTSYGGRVYLRCPALFTYQYSHAWVDFRDKRDAYADYWRNSVLATEAHRQFCIDLQNQFPKYGAQLWGITASDGPDGYKSWGGPPATVQPGIDGTIVPCAAGGSIPFAPEECLTTLQYMRQTYGDTIWKRYGFVDAFNPHTGWTDSDVIGIDVGITLVMAENYRSGFVWEQFMKNPEIQRALRLAGFHNTSQTLTAADRDYLKQLEHDTWESINSSIAPATPDGNLGLYLTDVVAAHEMQLIDAGDAECRISQAMGQLGQERLSAIDAAGLITVGQAFPELHDQCAQLLSQIDWSNAAEADSRLASFLAIASGQIQPALWNRGFGGGLFTQYTDGVWLDDGGTWMGLSARNLAFAQLTEAASDGLPAWGWSSVGQAFVIRPAACALAIKDYPEEVVANLRALEKSCPAARQPRSGFVASIDMKSQQTNDLFKIRDQSLLFLSLANYLQADVIHRLFQADPLVQRGRQLVTDYRQPAYGANVAVLASEPLPLDLRLAPQKTLIARRFNNWQKPEWQEMDAQNALENGVASDTSAKFSFAWDETSLHFKMMVHQAAVTNDCEPSQLYNQDCVELYIARQNEGLRWGNQADCQFGFAVGDKAWEWFGQNRKFQAAVKKCADGYTVDADIPWKTIGMTPAAGQFIQVSPAVRSSSVNHGATKLNWNWQPLGEAVQLGRLEFE